MKTLNIAYSFDDGYAQHAGLSILSLLESNKHIENIIFHIVTNSLNKENRKRIENIIHHYDRSIHYIDLNELTVELKIPTKFNRSAYGRLFLPNVIEDDRIIYVDSDTIINGSLESLMNVDLEDFLVAGVQDTVNPYYLTNIGLPNGHRYICDGGIIIINLKLWRKWGIVQKCIDFIMKYEGNPPHNDQGTINYVCAGHIKILSPHYNVMPPMFLFTVKRLQILFKMPVYYSQVEIEEALKKPVVIHYTDEFFNRPWYSNCSHPLKNLYLNYLSNSPWKGVQLKKKELSLNCKIQNTIYTYSPFFVYKWMIRFIEWKHCMKK